MADQKISELTALTGANLADVDAFAVVDTSAVQTKKITYAELKTALDTGTGFVRITGDTMTGNLSFGDDDKAIFGAGSDLQIYHDGDDSIITDTGEGNLIVKTNGNNIQFEDGSGNDIFKVTPTQTNIYHGTSGIKLSTTSTGISVTGSVTASSNLIASTAVYSNSGVFYGTSTLSLKNSSAGSFLDFASSGDATFGAPVAITSNTPIILFTESDQSNKQYKIGSFGAAFSIYDESASSFRYVLDTNGNHAFNDGTATFAGTVTANAGIDVTGTVTSDGLTVDNAGTIQLTKNTTASGDSLGIIEFHDEDGTATADAGKFQLQAFRGGDKDAPDFKLIGSDSTGVLRDRLQVEDNGSISFYEDTGTTAKFHWDASTERLGIGTSLPSRQIHLASSVPSLRLEDTDVSGLYGEIVQLATGDLSFRADHGDVQASSSMSFSVDGSQAMTIDSSANVGIGEIPQTDLNTAYDHLQIGKPVNIMGSDTNGGLWLNSGAFFNSAGSWEYLLSSETVSSLTMTNSIPFRFRYAAAGTAGNTFSWSEAVRIDSNGRILANGTSTNVASDATGNQFTYDGSANYLAVKRENASSSSAVAYFNRTGGYDGDIVTFRKDGTTVGSIGIAAGPVSYMVFNNTTSDNVAALKGASGAILPSTTAGADKDGTMNLGSSGARFENLYLSGVGHINGEVNVLTAGTMIQHDYLNSGTYVQEVRGDDRLLTLASKTNDSNAGIVFEIHSNEKARFNNAGNLAFTNGNGIDFSATSGTGTSELLDDYEEGEFDVTISPATSGTISISTSYDKMRYTKVGNIVHVQGEIRVASVSSPVGADVNINNLPFTSLNGTDFAGRVGGATYYYQASSSAIQVKAFRVVEQDNKIRFAVDASTVTANDEFAFNFTYTVA